MMPRYELEAIPFDKKAFPDVKVMEAAMRKATHDLRGKIMADFRSTVQTWEHAVNFRSRTEASGGNLVLYVYTADEIYRYVNDGTKPHIIKARNKPNLSVRMGFHPKTMPGRIQSGAGGYDGPVRFTPKVSHPGTVARNFAYTISQKYGYVMYTTMLDAIRRSMT